MSDDDVRWGEQLCVIRCGRLAECLYLERPVCLSCANELFDRELAADLRRRGLGEVM